MDDTDSLRGGCTTEVLFRLIQQLPTDVNVGQARLVRLWPFAQRRTRGNAAVAVELKTDDESALLQFLEGYWNDFILPLRGDVQASQHSDREQFPSDPGMVWFSKVESNELFYRNGLRQEIGEKDLPEATKSWGGHGKIGATLAVHWPAKASTFEAIAWRMQENTGPRKLDEKAIAIVDQMKETFLCRDGRLGASMLAPRGSSPVLFGVRTWTKQSAEEALQILIDATNTEPVAGSMVFETNHATNDHLDESLELQIEAIEIFKGGHALLHSTTERFLAFKESGQIASICQELRVGDVVECKGLRAPDGSIHIEFLQISHLVSNRKRPLCPTCNKSMSSMGRNQGLRCKKCGFKSEDVWDESPRSLPMNQWFQPPPPSRRHLAKPLDEQPERQNNL